ARYQWLWKEGEWERENAVKILLEKGADPNTRDSDGRNALMVMSMEHRPIVDIKYYIGKPRRRIPPPPPKPELADSAVGGPGGVAGVLPVPPAPPDNAIQSIGESLLKAGCDINAADIDGRTPLMYAVRYRRPTAVRLLLGRGANAKAKDKSGKTAL